MSVTVPKALPQANGDFYSINATLSEEDQALLRRVRDFLEAEVTPIINQYWIREEFPHQIIPKLATLGIAGLAYHGYGCPGKSTVLDGLLAMEIARVDSSIATFFGVNGALAIITLADCRVPEANRLQKANSFRDTAAVLRMTRAGVAWMAVGCARGAYELALTYSQERQQFGRPIGRFQLVQDLLVRMLGNITACECMVLRLSQMQDAGIMRDEHASLAKAFCTVKMRETVGYARELLGGNGILLDHQVGRFVADAEAIYSYEGTREMNTLIVGRAITGFSAFV